MRKFFTAMFLGLVLTVSAQDEDFTFIMDMSPLGNASAIPYHRGPWNSFTNTPMTSIGNGLFIATFSYEPDGSKNFAFTYSTDGGSTLIAEPNFSGGCSVPYNRTGGNNSNGSRFINTAGNDGLGGTNSGFTWAFAWGGCATDILRVWTGETDADWTTSTNWYGDLVPDENVDVYIPTTSNNPQVGGGDNALVRNIAIASGASLSVANEGSLAIFGDVTNSGTYTYSRNLTTSLGYSIMGSPVEDETVGDIGSNFFYAFNSTTDAYEAKGGSTTITPGEGYFVAKTTAGVVPFSGTPNSGNITHMTSASQFDLVANPYSAAISMGDFLTTNSSVIDGTLYFWDDGDANASASTRGGDYITVNSVAITTGTQNLSDGVAGLKGVTPASDGLIGSAQGFYVRANSTGGAVTFSQSMQDVAGSNAASSYYRESDDATVIKLALTAGGLYHETAVAFSELGSTGHDYGLDSYKLSDSKFSFYSLGNDNAQYAIQTFSSDHSFETSVALGFGVDGFSTFEISLIELENLPNGVSVMLFDKETSEFYDLTNLDAVALSSTSENFNENRFSLSLVNSVLAAEVQDQSWRINASKNGLEFTHLVDGDYSMSIHTLDGKAVYRGSIEIVSKKASLDASLQENVVYIVRVGDFNQKILIK